SVVTITLPVEAPTGTTATIEVALQLVIDVASVPLNWTVLVPFVAPKLVPVIVTEVPTGPDVGASCVIDGGIVTMNGTPLLGASVDRKRLADEARAGTTATMDVADQLVIDVATVPLNWTVLVPCVAPKLGPVIV